MNATIYESKGLHLDVLERSCPAIFATAPDSRVSAGYSFIPTRPILDAIVEDGWVLTGASTQLTGRGASARVKPHGAHLLRFRRTHADITNNDVFFEIILMNSHDRTKRYSLRAGIFRTICLNGLIVESHAFTPLNITHYNVRQTTADLVSGARILAARFGQLREIVQTMREHTMTPEQQISFARTAIDIRYRGSPTSLSPQTVLLSRRPEDEGDRVWNVFNRVQENLIVGGLHTGKNHTRPITSLFENIQLNTKLWQAAEELTVPQLAIN